jgi:hypothetical protein
LAAALNLPSKKRGWGCVMAFLHTPLSPLSRGESQKIEIPKHLISNTSAKLFPGQLLDEYNINY